jgi:DNA-binding FadR family transcriptional regulator
MMSNYYEESEAAVDDELIQGQVTAVRVACRRMTSQRLEALRQSVEQACVLPAMFGWDRKAAAHAEIFNMLADTVREPALRQVLNSGVGLMHHLMMTAGPVAGGVVSSSRRRVLACFLAGDPDGAAGELESELRFLQFTSRLVNSRAASGNPKEGAVA